MSGHGEKKNRLIEQFIANLLLKPSIEDAAAATGIGVASAYNWLKQPDVAEKYAEARRAVMDQAIAFLQNAAGKAVQCLREIVEDTDAPHTARVSAARTILDMAAKGSELDLERRIAQLEKLLLDQQQLKGA